MGQFDQGGLEPIRLGLLLLRAGRILFVCLLLSLRVFRAYLSTTIIDTPEPEPQPSQTSSQALPQSPPPQTPPQTLTRSYARYTTCTDRIRIRTALDWAIPRTIRRKYGYTLRQIRTAKESLLTP